jgi:hypothetical protein
MAVSFIGITIFAFFLRKEEGDGHGRDCMVVGFTTTYAINIKVQIIK